MAVVTLTLAHKLLVDESRVRCSCGWSTHLWSTESTQNIWTVHAYFSDRSRLCFKVS